jgi:hypothetical protein
MRKILAMAVLLSATCLAAAPSVAVTDVDLRGAWEAEKYLLKVGVEHPVKGRIFFTDTEWTVLFFVMGGDGAPKRGSAEGGNYTLSGDRLVFAHRFHLSFGEAMPGLAESPMRISVRGESEAPNEPCTVEQLGELLTIYFPSGNRMQFRRSSSF